MFYSSHLEAIIDATVTKILTGNAESPDSAVEEALSRAGITHQADKGYVTAGVLSRI